MAMQLVLCITTLRMLSLTSIASLCVIGVTHCIHNQEFIRKLLIHCDYVTLMCALIVSCSCIVLYILQLGDDDFGHGTVENFRTNNVNVNNKIKGIPK